MPSYMGRETLISPCTGREVEVVTIDGLRYSAVDPAEFYQEPKRFHDGDAGYDLTVSRSVTILPQSWAQIPTNIRVALPEGVWAMLIGRSSTFYTKQLLVNTSIIDNGWRGELWCLVYNLSNVSVTVKKGERVCQLILFNIVNPPVTKVDELPAGDRGERGFGSTGV